MFVIVRAKKIYIWAVCVFAVVLALVALPKIIASAHPAAASREAVDLPILMYHSILQDKAKTGTYIITPEQLKSDLAYLRENGYETVVVQDLIAYVTHGEPLPEKPIMLTFDDGHLNNWIYAAPLLKEYNMRAVLSIVGAYTDEATDNGENNVAYSYLNWEQIAQIHKEGIFELQNHSDNMHDLNGRRRGSLQVSGESAEQYSVSLSDDLGRMQSKVEEVTGVTPTTFTYPFGLVSKNSIAIIRELGFSASLTCEEGVNRIIAGEPECLFGLKRVLRSGFSSTREVMKKLR